MNLYGIKENSGLNSPSYSYLRRGVDVPNCRLYQLASHLRFVAEWVKEDPTSVWLCLEKLHTHCSLLGLLSCKNIKSVRTLRNKNPIIVNTDIFKFEILYLKQLHLLLKPLYLQ